MRKSSETQEEQALERRRVAGDLVAAGRERRHRAGQRLARAQRVEREQRAAARAGGDRHDHRLADRPRDGQDQGRHDARDRGRDDDPEARRRDPARAQAVGGLAKSHGDGPHRVLGDRRDERDRQDPDADAGGQEVERPSASVKIDWTTLGLIQVRAKKPRTTLGMPARISRIGLTVDRDLRTGVLGQVDRAGEADRCGDDHRDDRDDQRPGQHASAARTCRVAGTSPARTAVGTRSAPRNEIASKISVRTIPALIRIERIAAPNRTARIAPSLRRRAAVPRSRAVQLLAPTRGVGHVVHSGRNGGTGRTSELVRPVRGGRGYSAASHAVLVAASLSAGRFT